MHRCFCCCLFCIGICLCLYLGICLCLYICNRFTVASAAEQFPQQHWQAPQLTCSGSRSTRTWSPPPEGHSAQLSILRGRAICSDRHLAALALLFQPVHNALGWIPATKVNLRQTRSIFIFDAVSIMTIVANRCVTISRTSSCPIWNIAGLKASSQSLYIVCSQKS